MILDKPVGVSILVPIVVDPESTATGFFYNGVPDNVVIPAGETSAIFAVRSPTYSCGGNDSALGFGTLPRNLIAAGITTTVIGITEDNTAPTVGSIECTMPRAETTNAAH